MNLDVVEKLRSTTLVSLFLQPYVLTTFYGSFFYITLYLYELQCFVWKEKTTCFFLMNVSSASAHLLHKSVNVYMYIDLLLSCFSLIKPKSATILLFHKPLISWLIQQLTLGYWQRSYILYLCFLRRWAIEEIIYIKYFFGLVNQLMMNTRWSEAV